MAFDYTKKSSYHYLDVSQLDEALLAGLLYPRRTDATKNCLYLCDVAFIFEVLLSRYQAYRGITINGISMPAQAVPSLADGALRFRSFEGWDYFLAYNALPSTTYVFTSAEVAIRATIKYWNNQSTTPPGYYFFPISDDDKLRIANIADAMNTIRSYKLFYTSVFNFWQPLDATSFATSYVKQEEHFVINTDRICYKKIENFTFANYDGEAYTIRTNPVYTLSLTEPAKSCVNILVYALAIFHDDNNSGKMSYQFVNITGKTPETLSAELISRGKTICPATKVDGCTMQDFWITLYSPLYIYAQSRVTDIDPSTSVT